MTSEISQETTYNEIISKTEYVFFLARIEALEAVEEKTRGYINTLWKKIDEERDRADRLTDNLLNQNGLMGVSAVTREDAKERAQAAGVLSESLKEVFATETTLPGETPLVSPEEAKEVEDPDPNNAVVK
ncbi:MAG: hypothetical protein IH840_17630 [Candidatus Heimdallarchaeota archaeon]|nr:hypothetical protein [Candidatus Heimdallarchaeota archaeon]